MLQDEGCVWHKCYTCGNIWRSNRTPGKCPPCNDILIFEFKAPLLTVDYGKGLTLLEMYFKEGRLYIAN